MQVTEAPSHAVVPNKLTVAAIGLALLLAVALGVYFLGWWASAPLTLTACAVFGSVEHRIAGGRPSLGIVAYFAAAMWALVLYGRWTA